MIILLSVLQAGNQGAASDHNQPPNKRVRVVPPTTSSAASGGMVGSEYQVSDPVRLILCPIYLFEHGEHFVVGTCG